MKRLFAVLLTIIALGFIVFVGFMQQKFNNPEFSNLTAKTVDTNEQQTQSDNEEDAESNEETDDAIAGAAGSVVNEEEENESDEPVEVTTSTRTVIVESLNARSGPGVDYDLIGGLVIDQVVEVEDSGEEWVKVITDEFTGYVNEKYLSEE